MINAYLADEQEQREREALDARYREADKNCELEAKGRFDFISGREPDPELILEYFYRIGYQDAFWESYYQKYGKVELNFQEF